MVVFYDGSGIELPLDLAIRLGVLGLRFKGLIERVILSDDKDGCGGRKNMRQRTGSKLRLRSAAPFEIGYRWRG